MSDPTIVVIVAVLATVAGFALLMVSAWHFAHLYARTMDRRLPPGRHEDRQD